MKKYGLLFSTLLMTHACFPVNFKVQTHHKVDSVNAGAFQPFSISGKTIAIVIGAMLATKIAYDVSWHNASTVQASKMYQQLETAIQANQIESVTDSAFSALACQINCDNVLIYQSWVQNSYNNWLCPWNWTPSQKYALNQLKVVEALVLYADLVALFKNHSRTLTGSDLSQALRTKFMAISPYPLVSSYQALQNSIKFIASKEHDFCNTKINKLLYDMVPYLVYFQTLLSQDKDYILELQTKKMDMATMNNYYFLLSQHFDRHSD